MTEHTEHPPKRTSWMALLPVANHPNGCIGGAVIDQDKAIHLLKRQNPIHESRDHLFFVEAGGHHPELIAAHPRCLPGLEP